MLYGSGGKNRFLIYSTEKKLNYLADCSTMLCDCTFFSVPSIYKQLYSLHGLGEAGKTSPLVYILMVNHRSSLYSQVLNVLKELKPNINPDKIIIDLKMAFIKAVQDIFSDAILSGCNFPL